MGLNFFSESVMIAFALSLQILNLQFIMITRALS